MYRRKVKSLPQTQEHDESTGAHGFAVIVPLDNGNREAAHEDTFVYLPSTQLYKKAPP